MQRLGLFGRRSLGKQTATQVHSAVQRPRSPRSRPRTLVAHRAASAHPVERTTHVERISVNTLTPARTSRPRTRLRLSTSSRHHGPTRGRPDTRLSSPRIAAKTLAPLLAPEPVEVFAVACLSTRHHLLAWHVLSRGTRSSMPVSIPDVFVPACLTPGTTALIIVHNGGSRPQRRRCPPHAPSGCGGGHARCGLA
jgi:hypothetical protein